MYLSVCLLNLIVTSMYSMMVCTNAISHIFVIFKNWLVCYILYVKNEILIYKILHY